MYEGKAAGAAGVVSLVFRVFHWTTLMSCKGETSLPQTRRRILLQSFVWEYIDPVLQTANDEQASSRNRPN
jgi:hypothetical protein